MTVESQLPAEIPQNSRVTLSDLETVTKLLKKTRQEN